MKMEIRTPTAPDVGELEPDSPLSTVGMGVTLIVVGSCVSPKPPTVGFSVRGFVDGSGVFLKLG